MADLTSHPDPARLWRHRRRLVYASWCLLAAVVCVMLVWPERLAPAEPMVQTALWVLVFHIAAYYGTAVAEAFAGMRR